MDRTTEQNGTFTPRLERNVRGGFDRVTGITGAEIYLRTAWKEDEQATKDILMEAGLRKYDPYAIISLIQEDKVIRTALMDKLFDVEGRGLKEDGIFTMGEDRRLIEADDTTPYEARILCDAGEGQLMIFVASDLDTGGDNVARVELCAATSFAWFAPKTIVGTPIDGSASSAAT